MTTNFPTSVDALTNPTAGDALNSPSHSAQHTNANDAIEAIEGYLLTGAGRNQLVKIIPTSATGATVGADGTVNIISTVADVVISGAFSSTYDEYKIIFVGKCNNNNELFLSLNGITTGYYSSGTEMNATSATVLGWNYPFVAKWTVGWTDGTGLNRCEIDVAGVNSTAQKTGSATYTSSYDLNPRGGNAFLWSTSSATATGLTLSKGASNFLSGGTIKIYGYRK